MPRIFFAALAALFAVMAAHPATAQTDAQWAEVKRMNWRDASSVPLNMAHAVVRMPGFRFLGFDEASRYRMIIDGIAPINIEAVAVNFDTGSEFMFSWND